MNALKIYAATLVAMLLVGCASPPPQPNQYSLIASPVEIDGVTNSSLSGLLEVRRVNVADYLNDPRLMVQIGDNQLVSLPRQRWASPLAGELSALTVETFARALPGLKVLAGSSSEQETMVLDVEVNRFHLISDSQLRVAGRYQLKQPDGSYITGQFQREATFAANNYDDAVNQMRAIWIDEMTRIASEIQQ
ncbi:membrane integrity-associated transporter subunit PqiC [Neiella sp. HB171785]|uniref:Membrane integrity-associated transporter subunit PqiC n=1 Tax=Neiella litorisoli TaxID=2771431 RepID=A0A8J6UQ67_9GAMM|nr:ABC-type transport auxiliary lipoprotein family protein [Neiella litorisoli]MBD1390437.1 membrane integrity-associated transporter subunit PqiC [Neiella litorisoli]